MLINDKMMTTVPSPTTHATPMIECVMELLGEEIPARFQKDAIEKWSNLFQKTATEKGLPHKDVQGFITPNRMIIHAKIAASIAAQTVEKRGPRLNAPEKAVEGFCASVNLSKDQIMEKDGYFVANIVTPEQKTETLLPILLTEMVLAMTWPKVMRWPQSPNSWVRPVRHIMMLLDGKGVEGFCQPFELPFNDHTFGHRFLAHQKISPTSFEDYKEKLEKAYVMIDTHERKASIQKALMDKATAHAITLITDEKLLEENAGLVEYPGVFIGTLPKELLNTPEIVITTSMRVHQKCFAFRTQNGAIAPFFAAIVNTIPKDGGKAMATGYEMGMLKARLEDARFFFEQDMRTPLGDYNQKFDTVIFHEKLGSLGDKMRRLHNLCNHGYRTLLNNANLLVEDDHLHRAIDLCKSDLFTHMVGEFAELQGVMGSIYAKKQGEHADVAAAIGEYYQPQGPNDEVPSQPLSIALALMDKIDTLVGFIGHGILPTGSKDPFALRRQALGILRLLLENNLNLSLKKMIELSISSYLNNQQSLSPTTLKDVLNFLHTRALFLFKDKGYPHDLLQACLQQDEDDLLITPTHHKIEALATLLNHDTGKNLMAGFKRAWNICQSATDASSHVDVSLFGHEEEKKLYQSSQTVKELWSKHDTYVHQCELLASLKDPIDAFFNGVMVNDTNDHIRINRLNLLKEVISRFQDFADFTKID